VEIVNSRIAVFDSSGTRLKDVSLATFFGYTLHLLFDPRVVYDRARGRWVVSADAYPESPTTQFHFLAVSTTADATGDFYVYRINVTFGEADFWDFPQLGMTTDALILTANIFDRGATFKWADILAIPKDDIYAGGDLRVAVFQGFEGSLAPPIALDDAPVAFLLAPRPGSTFIALYALENAGDPDSADVVALPPITVDFYDVPPNARQPGTPVTIDTGDGRFVNASAQNGSSVFNVHAVNVAGFSTPRWYEIDTSTGEGIVVQTGTFFGAAASDDWNASIAVTDDNDAFVTWSSSEAPTADDSGYWPQIRVSGRLHTAPSGVIDAGSVVFQSETVATPPAFRWGDYSAITVDPLNPQCAWGVNEAVDSPLRWGTRIFEACFSVEAGTVRPASPVRDGDRSVFPRQR
jgi:hypothetical protein